MMNGFKKFVKFNRDVEAHEGCWKRLLHRHRRACEMGLRYKRRGLAELIPRLYSRATDERVLRSAWNRVMGTSGECPGVDGETCSIISGDAESLAAALRVYGDTDVAREAARATSDARVWRFLRGLRNEIRGGDYHPDRTRPSWIPKRSGGRRRLDIPTIQDRVVQTAIALVLRPLLNARFLDFSFGFRPRLGRLHALARGEHWLVGGRRVMLIEDIRDAFGSVPQEPLLDVVGHYLNDRRLLDLISLVVRTPAGRGIPQGGPLSPLLLNLYLHHRLDRWWRRRHPDLPLVRYADDIAVFCRSADEAAAARAALVDLLRPAGFRLKESPEPTAHDLGAGASARWLGYMVGWADDRLDVRLPADAWPRLEQNLAKAFRENQSLEHLARRLAGWVGQLGPAWACEDRDACHARVCAALAAAGFPRRYKRATFDAVWAGAHTGWLKLREACGSP